MDNIKGFNVYTDNLKGFDVYVHPNGKADAVKQGFCWPAAFFGPLWAFIAGLWGRGLLIIVVSLGLPILEGIALSYISVSTSNYSFILMLLVVAVSFGFQIYIPLFIGEFANDWRRKKLLRLGYKLEKTVVATSIQSAIKAEPEFENDLECYIPIERDINSIKLNQQVDYTDRFAKKLFPVIAIVFYIVVATTLFLFLYEAWRGR